MGNPARPAPTPWTTQQVSLGQDPVTNTVSSRQYLVILQTVSTIGGVPSLTAKISPTFNICFKDRLSKHRDYPKRDAEMKLINKIH